MQAEGMREPQVIREEGPGGTGELIVTFTKGPVSVGVSHQWPATDPSWDPLCSTDRYVAYLESEVFTLDLKWHTGDHSRGMVKYGWDQAEGFALACLADAWSQYAEGEPA